MIWGAARAMPMHVYKQCVHHGGVCGNQAYTRGMRLWTWFAHRCCVDNDHVLRALACPEEWNFGLNDTRMRSTVSELSRRIKLMRSPR